eukprot:CAMPEP_0114312172 /NCGR_PEP_ID=MMETSP0059-20121206/20271_1 /TAXON_ID=36894 /ORGANISM="Pyramimonas parkeae, Strain CCMP726" /LENGTH=404 /DNA_ID=CAMNT_0001436505 /DNA_START=436 /DNA_END=1651 /DNA_ORIENTATION=-
MLCRSRASLLGGWAGGVDAGDGAARSSMRFVRGVQQRVFLGLGVVVHFPLPGDPLALRPWRHRPAHPLRGVLHLQIEDAAAVQVRARAETRGLPGALLLLGLRAGAGGAGDASSHEQPEHARSARCLSADVGQQGLEGFALESSVDREGHVYVLNAHTGHPALGQVVDAYTAWRMPPPQMGVPVSSLAMGSIHSVPQGYTRENGPDANSVSLPNAVDGVPLEWATDTTMMPPIQQAFVGRPVETVDEQNADANPPSSSGNQPDRLRARDLYEGSQVIEDLLLNLERTMLTLDREAMIDRFVDTCMAQGIRLTCAQLKEVLFHVRQSQETLSDLVEKLFPYIADPGELETTVLDTLPVMFARRIRERLRINENQQSSEQRSMLQGDSDSPVRESSLDCVEDRRLQ